VRYLVTGGAGFIGSALCLQLLAIEAATVICVDALTYAANVETLNELEQINGFELVEADIRDFQSLDAAVTAAQPDIIFHLAAETHVDRSIDGAGVFIETNVLGTYNVLEAARAHYHRMNEESQRNFRLVHISTDEVFGSLGTEGAFSETTRYDPSSPYSASKAGSDHLVSAWHRTYGLPTVISNCSNNYGPRQFPEKLIPLMILNALEGKSLPVYGKGNNVRDWLHVEDHARALILLSKQGVPGETYNIGGDCERTNMQVVQQICDVLDRKHPDGAPHNRLITFVEDRPGHDLRYAVDFSKINHAFDWAPSFSFESGLTQTIEWYLDNDAWCQGARDDGRKRAGLKTQLTKGA